MSKAELVATVQKALGKEASSAQAERTVDAVIEGIKTGVKKTKSVQLVHCILENGYEFAMIGRWHSNV